MRKTIVVDSMPAGLVIVLESENIVLVGSDKNTLLEAKAQ